MSTNHQVRVAQYEAGFSLACTLVVCVHQEWGTFNGMASAVAFPAAMAFCVHGLNNTRGLGWWNLVYLPTRIVVIALGVAYSYQHYYHFLPDLAVGAWDLRPYVAVTMELLTLSALIAHQAHHTNQTTNTDQTADVDTHVVDDQADEQPTEDEPAAVVVPVAAGPLVPVFDAAPVSVPLTGPSTNGSL